MAKPTFGPLGAFVGTVGPVTGFIRNGRNLLRSSTSSVKDKRTSLQLAQREKMRICNLFTGAFSGTGFFNKSFPAYSHTGTGYNRATSALMSRALTGVSLDMVLSYPLVLISKGRLPGAQAAKATIKKGIIQFSFADNSSNGIAAADDTLILVAYAPDLHQAVFNLYGGFRKDKKGALNVSAFKGNAVETWIGFLSADERDASDSVYTGRLVV